MAGRGSLAQVRCVQQTVPWWCSTSRLKKTFWESVNENHPVWDYLLYTHQRWCQIEKGRVFGAEQGRKQSTKNNCKDVAIFPSTTKTRKCFYLHPCSTWTESFRKVPFFRNCFTALRRPKAEFPSPFTKVSAEGSGFHRTVEWFMLEETLKPTQPHSLLWAWCHPPAQPLQGPIHSLGHSQGWGTHTFSAPHVPGLTTTFRIQMWASSLFG